MPPLSVSLPSLSDTESVYEEDTISHEDETINLSIVTQLYDTRYDQEAGRFTETPVSSSSSSRLMTTVERDFWLSLRYRNASCRYSQHDVG